jgi:Zn-dependent peptidase ImmA (M78 family)
MIYSLINNEITQEEFIREYNIQILERRLPKNVYGLCFNKRNINFIVINSNLGEKNKKETLLHEFAHIELHHLDKVFFNTKIKDIEDEADEYIKELL